MSKTLEIVLTVPEGTSLGISRLGGSCEVAGVLPGSHAELAGLEPEDRILEVQGNVANGNNVRQLLAERTTEGLKLKVLRPASGWTSFDPFEGFGCGFVAQHPASVLVAHSLVKRADLNGEQVKLTPVQTKGRHTVHVVRTGEEVRIKPLNVVFVGVDDQVSSPGDRLFLACMIGDAAISIAERCLKQVGVNIDHIDGGVATPLTISSCRGQVECVKLLLDAKASVNFKDGMGIPPLFHACDYLAGTPETIRDISAIKPVAQGAAMGVLKMLLDANADPGQPFTIEGHTLTALSRSCGNGHIGCVEQLLSAKADANCIKDGVVQPDSSPLMCSCIKGHVTIAQKLLQAGALIDMKDKRDGRSALHYACCEDQLACVKLLIEAGADVNTSTPTGGTPVIYCGEGGKVACLRELIAARADLDYQDTDLETALFRSTTGGTHVAPPISA